MTIRKSGSDRDGRFEELYRRYYGRMYRFFVGNRVADDEAHDLCQEAFARFYEEMGKYRGEAEWGYLRTVARTVLLNRIRARKAIKRDMPLVDIDAPEFQEPADPNQEDVTQQLETARQTRRVHEEIELLPDGQKECMKLWLGDLKYQGIAKVLGISVDAVKSRLRDAKRLLRARLGADATLPEDDE